jgi:hypothetical protein
VVVAYNVYTVVSYSKSGGSIRRSGYTDGYLDVRDARTGKALFAKAPEFDGIMKLVGVTNNLAAVASNDGKGFDLHVLDLRTGKERFGPQDLARINGGLRFQPMLAYSDTLARDGFIFRATDARIYFIDGATGRTVQEEGHEDMIEDHNPRTMQYGETQIGFTGNGRLKAVNGTGSSTVDFINPAFAGRSDLRAADRVPLTYKDAVVVISRSSLDPDYNWVLTCLGRDSLEQRWAAEIPRAQNAASAFEMDPLFRMDNDTLLVLTNSSLDRFVAGSGKQLSHTPLP